MALSLMHAWLILLIYFLIHLRILSYVFEKLSIDNIGMVLYIGSEFSGGSCEVMNRVTEVRLLTSGDAQVLWEGITGTVVTLVSSVLLLRSAATRNKRGGHVRQLHPFYKFVHFTYNLLFCIKNRMTVITSLFFACSISEKIISILVRKTRLLYSSLLFLFVPQQAKICQFFF